MTKEEIEQLKIDFFLAYRDKSRREEAQRIRQEFFKKVPDNHHQALIWNSVIKFYYDRIGDPIDE